MQARMLRKKTIRSRHLLGGLELKCAIAIPKNKNCVGQLWWAVLDLHHLRSPSLYKVSNTTPPSKVFTYTPLFKVSISTPLQRPPNSFRSHRHSSQSRSRDPYRVPPPSPQTTSAWYKAWVWPSQYVPQGYVRQAGRNQLNIITLTHYYSPFIDACKILCTIC